MMPASYSDITQAGRVTRSQTYDLSRGEHALQDCEPRIRPVYELILVYEARTQYEARMTFI